MKLKLLLLANIFRCYNNYDANSYNFCLDITTNYLGSLTTL